MRADRLLTILLLLQNHGRMTSKQLAERLEVSERTVHRDMEALSASGVPVYALRGADGGWALAEGYRSNLTGMKINELQSLLVASPAALLNDLGLHENYEAAFLKLLSALPKTVQQDAIHVRQLLHIDGAGWHESTETFPFLSIVQDAVWLSRKLFIRYMREDVAVERIVCPLGLVAKRSIWYLVAKVDEDMRTYRISRLLDAQLLDDSFLRPSDFDLASYWEQSTLDFKSSLPRYPARLLVKKGTLPAVKQERYIKIASTQAATDDWMEAEVEFHTLASACSLVLSFGPHIQVLEPQELKRELIEQVRATLGLYEAPN
ncbi:WYL domain-containing protein [Brevibacillus formosus]|uniref:helix-turn-helix transcriptional regulator n=1 Tax=Brevibacillus formosus TaxID=54913 RepID=UPI001C6788F6|nr:YafY family protein [Brevibacillus formosus]MBW5469547.1 WYL domain-containing protein [Brevibacillus formosus]